MGLQWRQPAAGRATGPSPTAASATAYEKYMYLQYICSNVTVYWLTNESLSTINNLIKLSYEEYNALLVTCETHVLFDYETRVLFDYDVSALWAVK